MSSTAAMGYSSLAHRVTSIPELLELIFQHLDRASNASNASVCKIWSQMALDTLWRHVDDIHRLFSLLAPMIPTPAGYHFERLIEPSDWSRFLLYARRVRRFCYDDSKIGCPISVLTFEEIAQTRTTLSVLPNLRDLEWNTTSLALRRFSVLFMSETVRSFTFLLSPDCPLIPFPGDVDPVSFLPFFQDIATRMPLLTHLDMRTDQATKQSHTTEFIQLISWLPKLQKVVVPLYLITSEVFEGLSKLENLGIIQFEFSQGSGNQDDIKSFNPVLAEGAFPALWDLSLSVHLSHFTTLIQAPFAPTHLSSVYIHAISVDGESSIQQFFSAIADHCPLIESLYLECLPGPILSTQWDLPPSQFETLTMNTLKPLLECSKLKTFELMYSAPLILTIDDLEELTSKWHSLESICLNAEPVLEVGVRSNLTLRALLPFAGNCPNLRKLGLFFNATAADIPSPSEIPQRFTKLAKLMVGVSSIAEAGPVALFLSRICPVGCSIISGVSWPDPDLDLPVMLEPAKAMHRWCELWDEVDTYLPLLTKLRMEEQETRRELQEEVEDLRTRTRILMDQAQLPLSGDGDESCVVA